MKNLLLNLKSWAVKVLIFLIKSATALALGLLISLTLWKASALLNVLMPIVGLGPLTSNPTFVGLIFGACLLLGVAIGSALVMAPGESRRRA